MSESFKNYDHLEQRMIEIFGKDVTVFEDENGQIVIETGLEEASNGRIIPFEGDPDDDEPSNSDDDDDDEDEDGDDDEDDDDKDD